MKMFLPIMIHLYLAAVLYGSSTDALAGAPPPPSPSPPTLDVSTDLTQLPGQYHELVNMVPTDNPSVDSASLLQDAIDWVIYWNTNPNHKTDPYTTITASKPGTFFFNNYVPTVANPDGSATQLTYIFANGLSNVTIDLNGSLLLGKLSFLSVFNIENCNNCTFRNFAIDYQNLPFTQVTVQTVDSNTNTLTVTTQVATPGQPAYVSPYQLYQNQNTPDPVQNNATIYGFDFRNGQPVYSYGRWDLEQPTLPVSNVNSNIITITDPSSYLNLIHPGDTFVVEARGGDPAILVTSSPGTAFTNIRVYSSGEVGIIVSNIFNNNVSFNGVSIIPGPGRLVSTNADGISFQQPGANNSINNCEIALTQDDGISMVCWPLGVVQATNTAGSVLALEKPLNQIDVPYSAGTPVYFIDPISCLPVAQSTIKQVMPNHSVRVSPAVPNVGNGFLVLDADKSHRGDGLSIRENRIGPIVFARGISVFGLTGVNIAENTIRSTQQAGVLMMNQLNNPHSWVNGPNYNITILDNSLENTNRATGPLVPEMLAAIQLRTLNAENSPVITAPNQGILIYHNQITDTPRSGIWLENASSGAVSGNILRNTGFDPFVSQGSTLFGLSGAKAVLDFRTPVVIQSSHVAVGVNTSIQ